MPDLQIPETDWEPVGEPDIASGADERSRLVTTIEINGLAMHLEAWQIVDAPDATFTIPRELDRRLSHFKHAVDYDGDNFGTVTIAGRPYILLAYPDAA